MIAKIIFIGTVVIAINLVIQGLGNIFWLRKIATTIKNETNISNRNILKDLLFSFLLFTFIHTVHALIWALFYYLIPQTGVQFSSFSEAVYFSMVTFTSLGYGDIALVSEWRILSGVEAINGLLLLGWSTAMMYSLIENIYKKLKK